MVLHTKINTRYNTGKICLEKYFKKIVKNMYL